MASTAPSSPPPPPSPPAAALAPLDSLGANAGSETSVGFAEPCPSNIVVSANLPVIPPSEKAVPLLDACCLALYCQAHEKLLLSPLKGGVGVGAIKGLYLPTVSTMRSDYDSWNAVAGRLLYSTLRMAQKKSAVVGGGGSAAAESRSVGVVVNTTALHCIDWYRVQQPKKAPAYSTRVTFVSSIPSGQKCYCFSSKATAVGVTSSAVGAAAVPQIPPLSSAIIGGTNTTIAVATSGSMTNNSSNISKRDFWLTVEELKQTTFQDSLWGPEVVAIAEEARAHYSGTKQKTEASAEAEWTGSKWMHEVNVEDALALLANRSGEYSRERALLFSARYSEEEVLKLFNEFVVQCFPSQYMSFASFRAFMAKLGWHEEDSLLKAIFSTLVSSAGERVALMREKDSVSSNNNDNNNNNANNNTKAADKSNPLLYLTFSELLLGLSTMEERADHRGDCLLIRLKYIFHFYDEDRDGRLNRKELDKFVGDVGAKGRGGAGTASAVASSNIESSRSNEGIRLMMSAVKASGPGSSINGPTSSNATGTAANPANELVEELFNKLTNSSAPLTEESAISEQQFTEPATAAAAERLAELTETLFRSSQSTVESATGRFAYRRVGHLLGRLGVGARQVAALSRYDEPCERCRRTARFDLCTHGIRVDEWGAIRGTIKFNLCSDYRDVTFRQEVAIDESTFDWIMQFNRYVSMINSTGGSAGGNPLPRPDRYGIKSILELVLSLVRSEPPVVHLSSPCYIIGEVRSSLETLYRLQSTIARWYPFVNPANLVLLGNAVDGADPLAADTAVYLLCLKALSPCRITLLRGPLEVTAVADKNSQLRRDWVALYGEATWKSLVAIVEQLPVAAVLDSRLFLTKSGLPQPVMSIEAVEQTLKGALGTGSASDSKKAANSAAQLLLNSLGNGVYVLNSTQQGPSRRSKSAKNSKRKAKSARSKSSQASAGGGGGGGTRPKTSVATKKRTRTPGQVSTGGKVSKAKLHKASGARKSAAPPPKRSPRSKGSAASTAATSSARNNSADKGSGRSTPLSSSPSPTLPTSSETPSTKRNQPVFSTAALQHFLRLNGLSHCIRTEMLPPIGAGGPFRVAVGGRLITIGGIGKQQSPAASGGAGKLWGSILLATRQKVRIISLKSLFAGRHAS